MNNVLHIINLLLKMIKVAIDEYLGFVLNPFLTLVIGWNTAFNGPPKPFHIGSKIFQVVR